jgi:lactate permease
VAAGVAFALSQFVTSNFIAVEITDVVASVVTLTVVLLMLRVWKPGHTVVFEHAEEVTSTVAAGEASLPVTRTAVGGTGTGKTATSTAAAAPDMGPVGTVDQSARSIANLTWNAVMPYVVIIVVFAISQIPLVKTFLADVATMSFPWPGLAIADAGGNPVASVYSLNVVGTGGTLLLLSGVIVATAYRIPVRDAVSAYGATLHQLRFTIITVTAVLALAYVMNYSGQTQSLGSALAASGAFFAILSPSIGWLGVAITGSDTSSNALFGLLQATTAEQVGLNPILMAATNSSAGVLGKMLSPQNLAVAAAAASMAGREGDLFRKLIGWSLGMLAVFTVFVALQSTPVLGWMVPVAP